MPLLSCINIPRDASNTSVTPPTIQERREYIASQIGSSLLNIIPDYIYRDPSGIIPITVRCHVMSVYNIDAVNQKFDCKIWIQMIYRANKTPADLELLKNDIDSWWYPRLDFVNNIDELKTINMVMKFIPVTDSTTEIRLRYLVQGTFYEHFEVQQFPFDHQQLQITCFLWECPQSLDKVDFPSRVKFNNGGTQIYEENFVQSDSWLLTKKTVKMTQGKTLATRQDDGIRFATIRLIINIERKYRFYFWNIVFPTFVLVSLSFGSFVIDTTELVDRLSITLTLILTIIALKFAVSQYLPTTSYLTYLDVYVISSYIMLSCVAIQNIVCKMIAYYQDDNAPDGKHAITFNRTTGTILGVFWLFMNSVMLCILNRKIRHKYIHKYRITPVNSDDIEIPLSSINTPTRTSASTITSAYTT